jgi:hypothetical protein
MDFMQDVLADGRRFRTLNILTRSRANAWRLKWTRRCLGRGWSACSTSSCSCTVRPSYSGPKNSDSEAARNKIDYRA